MSYRDLEKFEIKISGSGTAKEITAALRTVLTMLSGKIKHCLQKLNQ